MRTSVTAVHSTINTAQAKKSREAVAQPLNERAADCATGVVQALSNFGAPLSVVQPYASPRPFLEALSGRDPLRVMRAARDSFGAYSWWAK